MSLAGQIGLLASRIATEINSVRAALNTQTGDPTPEDFSATFNGLLTAPAAAAGTASETAAGVTQFATAAEVRAGTVANHAVSPLQLAAWGAPVIPCADFGTLSAQANAAPTGSLLAVQGYAVTSAINHVASLWLKGADGKARPVSPIFIGGGTSGDPAGQGKANASTVLSYLVGYGNLAVPVNTVIFDDFKNEFRLVSGSNVKCWDSDWIGFTLGVAGISGSLGASPGWTLTYSEYRFAAGKVRVRAQIGLNGGTASVNGQIVLTMPIAYVSKAGLTAPQQATAFDMSDSYAEYSLSMSLSSSGGTSVWLGSNSTSGTYGKRTATSPTVPITWGQGDQVTFEIEYDQP